MPPAVRTIEDVVRHLNSDPATVAAAPWIPADGYLALTEFTIAPQINFNPNRGIAIKGFISTSTAEVKIFLVKLLEVPDRNNLWP